MSEPLRRLAWRLGRRVYSRARGEMSSDDIATNGEAEVQRRVVAGAGARDEPLAILDIGAFRGDWTLLLLEALPPELRSPDRLRLHLFEPVPETRARLVATLAAAGAGDLARVHDLALSETSGRARMQIVGEGSGRNSLNTLELDAADAIDVETITLADLFARLGVARAALVKMDAEGHDLAILHGARELLASSRIDVVQFEYNHTWVFARAFLKDVFDLIEGLPYRLARVRPHGVELFETWHPELERFFHANYALIEERALAWFSVRRGRFDDSNTYA